jgi:pimeloyl-ACP methyl ester carboxylesterase
MPKTRVGDLELAYETKGDPAGSPLLLIMGLGAQLVVWDEDFITRLAARGHYVIYYDNRDVGESTHLDHLPATSMATVMMQLATDQPVEAPYSLNDLADDALGLLTALGVKSAHVVGLSMGGMVAQILALRAPERVRSLTSIMSTTNDRGLPPPEPHAAQALMTLFSSTVREVSQALELYRVLAGPHFPFDEQRILLRLMRSVQRGFSAAGVARQFLAITAAPGRGEALRAVRVPALVIHGDKDPLIPPAAGTATAAAIPNARLWLVPGMGHDVPPELFEPIATAIADHAAAAEKRSDATA